MKNLQAAYRLLKHSSRNSLDHRANRRAINFTLTYELFSRDVCCQNQIVSRSISFLRCYGSGILCTFPRVKSDGFGNGFHLHYRNLASIAPIPVRNESFSMTNSDDISYFKKILGDKGVVQEKEKLDDANMDWMRKYKGSSQLMLLPRSTQDVSQVLAYCNSRCLAVVPQGGNTGLVGGSVPVFDEA